MTKRVKAYIAENQNKKADYRQDVWSIRPTRELVQEYIDCIYNEPHKWKPIPCEIVIKEKK